MFAYGPKNGCIRIKDVTTDEVMVLKKSFIWEETVEDVYDTIKMQKLAALCCQLFCAKSGEQCQCAPLQACSSECVMPNSRAHRLNLARRNRPQFLDACIYVLKQRPSMPKIRVEARPTVCCLYTMQRSRIRAAIAERPCTKQAVVAEPYDKRPLALAPATASHEDVVESHLFAAFQYFTYVQSGRGMVVTHAQVHSAPCCRVPVFSARESSPRSSAGSN